MTTTVPTQTRTVPGAMEHTKRRELHDGAVIEFEQAPAGWLTQDGNVRERDWRAYYYTATAACIVCEGSGRVPSEKRPGGTVKCNPCKGSGEGKRLRFPSVSDIGNRTCPKDGIPPWSEARGIEGAIEAVRLGLIDATDPASAAMAVDIVRQHRLGADRARDTAAERGINIHRLLEDYMTTGKLANPADHPVEHAGYLQGLARWLLRYNPEPEVVEQVVAHPTLGYAGRLDLIARIGGRRVLVDLKTQERGMIFRAAHVQSRLYALAEVACGGEPVDAIEVAVVAADGEHRVMACAVDEAAAFVTLGFWRAMKPVDSACESANRVERDARRAAA